MKQAICQSNYLDRPYESLFSTLFQITGGALFLALCAQIRIPLSFTSVPLTLQTGAVLLLGGLFGSRKGTLMVLTYLAQVLAGFPVLAGGLVDPFVILGPKGGYLIGFIMQAYIMGWFVERMPAYRTKFVLGGGLLACTMQMGLGLCWIAQFVGWKAAPLMGLYPFIPGEILKVLTVTALVKNYRRWPLS